MLKTALIALTCLYAAIMAAMYFWQRSFLYFPDPARSAPADVELPDVVERIIETADGQKLIAWYGRAKLGQPTILYFHGNAGALEVRRERIRKYLDRGRGMFMMAYRGYSGSSGQPSEAANVADAQAAYDALIKEGVKPNDIIIYGESLGSSVAIQLARVKPAAGLVLDSPFTSVTDRAAEIYPWLPVRWLLTDRYESSRYISDIRIPLFILHGEADDIVPVAMGRALFALANEPKEIVTLPGAGHGDHWKFGSLEAINAWIDRLRAGSIGAAAK